MWGRAKQARGINEDTWDEHWVLYVGDESLDSTLKSLLHYTLTNLDVYLKQNKTKPLLVGNNPKDEFPGIASRPAVLVLQNPHFSDVVFSVCRGNI